MKLYFAPDQDCLTPLLNVINNATTTITVADYSFNSPEITTALIAKHQAGVKVQMVLDKSQSKGKTEIPQVQRLQDAEVDFVVGTSDKHRIMHLKVVVGDDTIGFGSYNFTTTAALENNVVGVYTDSADAELFVTQIRHAYLWIVQNQSRGLKSMVERTNMNIKDIAVRALKTFGQALGAFVVVHLTAITAVHSVSTAKQLAFAGIVAGVSAVWNLVLVPLFAPVTAKLGL